MKKVLILGTLVSSILVGCMDKEVEKSDVQNNIVGNKSSVSEAKDVQVKSKGTETLIEYPMLEANIDTSLYDTQVVEDNKNKRIILFKDQETGEMEYKSIFAKREKRLKILSTQDGLIFNEIIM
ncbi:hypothetical protein ACFFIS_06090 [Virgibacillus soli]|uniref:Lipoprotein n=1 Tax=Paracerasibacillus soli TaxID=480284 RepID=A0ABU5CUC2_9BACI|nr:hypothetical protein [Virgibacillus soli]MDY0409906.1 hypothetical protein [Virgibacillus soli]